jgi:hypothetical protein
MVQYVDFKKCQLKIAYHSASQLFILDIV